VFGQNAGFETSVIEEKDDSVLENLLHDTNVL